MDSQLVAVSGATGGIGKAIARRFAKGGASLILMARHGGALTRAAREIRVSAGRRVQIECVPVDLGEASSIRCAYSRIIQKGLTITTLVHAAGDGPVGGLFDATDFQWFTTINVKLLGAVRLTRCFAADMLSRGCGCVIFVNGVLAREPHPLLLVNSAVNGAMMGLAKAISKELKTAGVRVNVVNPGATDTSLWRQISEEMASRSSVTTAEFRSAVAAGCLGDRIANPGDIADVVHFLASEGARHVTGASLTVDGGATETT